MQTFTFNKATSALDKVNVCENMISQIFDYLRNNRQWEHEKYFTNGEFDSNQTKYEKLANNLKIAVKAYSEKEGYILLYLLRCIVDENSPKYIYDQLSEDVKSHKNDIVNIIKVMASYETSYSDIFDKGKPLTVKLTKVHDVERDGPIEENNDEKKYIKDVIYGENGYLCVTTINRQPSQVIVWDIDSIELMMKTILARSLVTDSAGKL